MDTAQLTGYCCLDKGIDQAETMTLSTGAKITKGDVARVCVDSCRARSAELPGVPMGSSKKRYERAVSARISAAQKFAVNAVAEAFEISKTRLMAILFIGVLAIVAGPLVAVVAVLVAVVEWYVNAELDHKYGLAY